jgi:transcription initiation factor TFIID TATA-box-binding protein
MFLKSGVLISGKPRIQIQNIVASANLGMEVLLEKAAYLLENTMYEPEQFPGLIYRLVDPKVVLLIFSSGKMVITGAKSEEEVEKAVNHTYKTLLDLNCLKKIERSEEELEREIELEEI